MYVHVHPKMIFGTFFFWKRLIYLLSRTGTTAQCYLWLNHHAVVKGIQIASPSFICILKGQAWEIPLLMCSMDGTCRASQKLKNILQYEAQCTEVCRGCRTTPQLASVSSVFPALGSYSSFHYHSAIHLVLPHSNLTVVSIWYFICPHISASKSAHFPHRLYTYTVFFSC